MVTVIGKLICLRDFDSISFVLFFFSEPQATCFVATSNLDGETNLKIRQVKTP